MFAHLLEFFQKIANAVLGPIEGYVVDKVTPSTLG